MSNPISDKENLPVEINFDGGIRGKYAHLFGEVPEDEQSVANFWRVNGFEVQMSQDNHGPDIALFLRGELVAYCEVKTIVQDAIFKQAQSDHSTVAQVMVSNAVYSAARLFGAANPTHSVPNFLFLINKTKFATLDHLFNTVSAYWDPLHRNYVSGKAKLVDGHLTHGDSWNLSYLLRSVDSYIWRKSVLDSSSIGDADIFGGPEGVELVAALMGKRNLPRQ